MKSKIINLFLRMLPNFLWPLKVFLIKKTLGYCGEKVKISPNSTINYKNRVFIEDYVFINERFYCSVRKNLYIGKRVMFGPDVMIIGGDHDFSLVGKILRFIPENINLNHDIIIEDDVWVASRVTILKNVTLGEGSIIGSNSLITKNVPPYTIAFGIPAKIIKPRFAKSDLEHHLKEIGSNYTIEQLNYIYD